MSYALNLAVTFRNQPSLTLNAQLYDSAGATVGSAITSGIVNLGNGSYSYLATIPNGQVGSFVIWDSALATRQIAFSINPAELEYSTDIGAIKAKTDNLPSDPADASDIATSFGTIASTLATIAAYIDTEVAAIKAKTDNLPSDPADASDIASSFATVSSTLSTIAGYIDTEVAAIKAKTDNLPSSPAAVSDIPTAAAINTALTTAHGAGAWTTADVSALATNAALATVGTNVSAILTDIAALPNAAAIVTAIFAHAIASGKTFNQAMVDLWAAKVGDATADSAINPTSEAYKGPDGTVQVTHTLTPTTRTNV